MNARGGRLNDSVICAAIIAHVIPSGNTPTCVAYAEVNIHRTKTTMAESFLR